MCPSRQQHLLSSTLRCIFSRRSKVPLCPFSNPHRPSNLILPSPWQASDSGAMQPGGLHPFVQLMPASDATGSSLNYPHVGQTTRSRGFRAPGAQREPYLGPRRPSGGSSSTERSATTPDEVPASPDPGRARSRNITQARLRELSSLLSDLSMTASEVQRRRDQNREAQKALRERKKVRCCLSVCVGVRDRDDSRIQEPG